MMASGPPKFSLDRAVSIRMIPQSYHAVPGELGRGAIGVVYKARQVALAESVRPR
jgi:hypothetical protein